MEAVTFAHIIPPTIYYKVNTVEMQYFRRTALKHRIKSFFERSFGTVKQLLHLKPPINDSVEVQCSIEPRQKTIFERRTALDCVAEVAKLPSNLWKAPRMELQLIKLPTFATQSKRSCKFWFSVSTAKMRYIVELKQNAELAVDFFHWDEELIIEVFSHFKLFSCTMTATEFAIDVDILQLLLVQSANKKDVCEWRIAVPNKSLPDWRPMVARNPFFYRIDLFSSLDEEAIILLRELPFFMTDDLAAAILSLAHEMHISHSESAVIAEKPTQLGFVCATPHTQNHASNAQFALDAVFDAHCTEIENEKCFQTLHDTHKAAFTAKEANQKNDIRTECESYCISQVQETLRVVEEAEFNDSEAAELYSCKASKSKADRKRNENQVDEYAWYNFALLAVDGESELGIDQATGADSILEFIDMRYRFPTESEQNIKDMLERLSHLAELAFFDAEDSIAWCNTLLILKSFCELPYARCDDLIFYLHYLSQETWTPETPRYWCWKSDTTVLSVKLSVPPIRRFQRRFDRENEQVSFELARK